MSEEAMTDGIKSIKPFLAVRWICENCCNVNTISFYKWKEYDLHECAMCEHAYRLQGLD